MTVQPFGDRLIVQPEKKQADFTLGNTTDDTAAEVATKVYTVISTWGDFSVVRRGDKVIAKVSDVIQVTVQGETIHILPQHNILAIIK